MKNIYSDDLFFQLQLQAHITGELRGEALNAFNETIAQSPDAANEAQFSHKLATVLRHEDKFAMSAILANIIAEEGIPPAPPQSGSGWKWTSKTAILASIVFIVVLLAGGVFIYNTVSDNKWGSTSALYEHYFTPLENVIVTPENPAGLELFDQGMAAYDRADYAKSAELLSRFYQQSGDANAALFLGVAHLELGDQKAAITALQNASGNLQSPSLDACHWYLALAYLKDGDKALATAFLKMIPAEGVYGEQAKALLERMEKLN